MGQYFKAVIAKGDNKEFQVRDVVACWYAGDFGGAKLMEHSYVGNDFVGIVTDKLAEIGPARLRWTGDYGDENAKLYGTHEYNGKVYENNLFQATEDMNIEDDDWSGKKYRFGINHDKKEYFDLQDCPEDSYGYIVHPLPLLCCDSNGRGGGDFNQEDHPSYNLIGSWAGDTVSVSFTEPQGYKKIEPGFIEN